MKERNKIKERMNVSNPHWSQQLNSEEMGQSDLTALTRYIYC